VKCSEYELLISAYADGELDGPEKTRLEGHFADCEDCRRLYEETVVLQRKLADSMLACSYVPDLVSAVSARVRPRVRTRLTWAWAKAAAVIVLISVCAYVLLQPRPPVRPAGTVVARDRHRTAAPRNTEQTYVHKEPKEPSRMPDTARMVRHRAQKAATHSEQAAKPTGPTSAVALDTAEVTIEYTDAELVADRSADLTVLSPELVPAAAPGRQVVAAIEVIAENGKQLQRVCHYVIESSERTRTLNEPSKGETNGTN